MKKTIIFVLMLTMTVAFVSCGGKKRSDILAESGENAAVDSASTIKPKYAKGFKVRYTSDGVRLVDVADPQKDKDKMPATYHFALVDKDKPAVIPDGYLKIEVPIERTIVMTMLQLSNFTAIDACDVIKGITGTKNLFDKDIKARVEKGDIVKIGKEGNFDTELIMAAQPDVIFISPFKRGGYDAIKETGITLIPHLGYKELDPLGQAEWIKYIAMFVGKEAEANKLFSEIEQRYRQTDIKKCRCIFVRHFYRKYMPGKSREILFAYQLSVHLNTFSYSDQVRRCEESGLIAVRL